MSGSEHIVKFLSKGLRYDGRKLTDFRSVIVESGFLKTAEGSSRVVIGDTEVIAGVKFELGEPYDDSPDEGNLMVNAELSPLSDPDFETGPPSEFAIEVARVTDRCLRESKSLDFGKLVVKSGEKVWTVIVDIVSVNNGGNLLDAGVLAAVVALKNAKFPKVVDGVIDYKELTKVSVPLLDFPVAVTVFKVGDVLFVDPIREEEKVFDCRVTFGFTSKGDLCALQKGGGGFISEKELEEMISLAESSVKGLRKLL